MLAFFGQNLNIKRFFTTFIANRKPKYPTAKVITLIPEAQHVAQRVRISSAVAGSVDMTNPFLVITKTSIGKKATDRRYLKGNTSFSHITDVPLLNPQEFDMVHSKAREYNSIIYSIDCIV